MTCNAPENVVYIAAKQHEKNFDNLVSEFNQDHINQAVKSLANISKRCRPSCLVRMLKAKRRKELIDPIFPSSSTLLVVPNFLFQLWEVAKWYVFEYLHINIIIRSNVALHWISILHWNWTEQICLPPYIMLKKTLWIFQVCLIWHQQF